MTSVHAAKHLTMNRVDAKMPTPKELFDCWYAIPLKYLEGLPNGTGAFVALAVSCFLYERYATAYLKDNGKSANDKNRIKQLASDFQVDENTANAFWNVVRNGFLHQGMGLQKNNQGGSFPEWAVSHDFPCIALEEGSPGLLKIQPWLFRDRVLELWERRPDLIEKNDSFPWATVWHI
jgi:hypothetical protein